jgi:adenylate kinase family enzyme
MDGKRIVIVGTSCSGKTTLAKAIAAKRDIPHIELDVLFWNPDWTETSRAEFHNRIRHAVNCNESWVLCGNYNSAKEITLPAATDIVWLHYPLYKNFWRGLKRSIKRILSGADVFEGCKETFRLTFLSRDSILLWILKTHKRRRLEFEQLLTKDKFPFAHIWVVRTEEEYQKLLSRL